jgi:hypothetical protein
MTGKYVVVYNVLEVARGNSPEKTLRQYIQDLILMDNANLWSLMEPYFVPPGKEGRRDYDHAEAVAVLKRESRGHSREKKMPDPLDGLNTSALVPHLLKVLVTIGFVVSRGKIIGTKQELEDVPPDHEAYENLDGSEELQAAA